MYIMEIVKTLPALDEDIQELEKDILNLQTKLELLKEFRVKLANENSNNNSTSIQIRKSIVDSIEQILKINKNPMHANDILKVLENQGFKTNKNSIVATISSYANRGERFKTLGKNIFDLLENQKA